MNDPMTPAQRATAYEVEAAQIIDRTIRKLPEGVTSAASLKLVELIVQAAVERMSAVTNIAVVADPGSACAAAFRCTLAPNHDGLHKFEPE